MRISKVTPVYFALFFLAISNAALAQDTSSQAPSTSSPSAITALPSDIDPNSPLAQIINLAQSGVSENVLVSYAGNSATPFNLTADQIIYLKDIGVPDSVVQAMIQRDQQLGATDNIQAAAQPAPETEPPGGDVTSDYFYGALAPYGGWVNVNGYGLCWRPSVTIYNSGWQPYCDHGHWVNTDEGWFWVSDYSWGWAPFHYGRWFHDAQWGWCWWPDTAWAPSWVCWRYSDSYCGWAPLPPHSVYVAGVGFQYNGITVGANFDFGIGVNFFTFVPTANFCDPHPDKFRVGAGHIPAVYRQTTVVNNFGVQNNTFVNHGIDPRRISAVTHSPIQTVSIRESGSPVARGEVLGGNQTLVINRPHFTDTSINTLHQGVPPREIPQQSAPHTWYVTQPRQNNVPQPAENQTYRTTSNPGLNNENSVRSTENIQPPEASSPDQTRSAPQESHEITPVEHNTPADAERVPQASSESHYHDNQEPVPEDNYNTGNRYSSPRSQEQTPQAQPSHESVPAQSHAAPPQQSQQSQGQKNKNGY